MSSGEEQIGLDERFAVLERKLRKLNNLLQDTIHENEYLFEWIDKLQVNMCQMQQYSRRENIEIIGVPDSITLVNLEKTVIEVLHKIDIDVTSYDIAACHRLKKKKNATSANVIVRFINRKKAIDCMKKQKIVKNTN